LAPIKKIALLSIDVEEWFHLDYIKDRSSPVTMLDGLDRFLAFADNENIPATLFTLTDLLPRLSDLFKSAVTSGHEIALHGTSHKRPLEMT
jgi:peptidoglycan/xylan/chitin deacetylase (PgdA/CDA1 family)